MNTGILAVGALSALGVFVILMRFGLNFMVRNSKWIDVAFTIALAFLFFGTFSGMAAAALGGLILSCLLWAVKFYGRITGQI